MPYVSKKQRGMMHANEERGEVAHSVVDEFDRASKGKSLPDRVKRKVIDRRSAMERIKSK